MADWMTRNPQINDSPNLLGHHVWWDGHGEPRYGKKDKIPFTIHVESGFRFWKCEWGRGLDLDPS
jgi:hypothetical protein